jgi:hypothetical protein
VNYCVHTSLHVYTISLMHVVYAWCAGTAASRCPECYHGCLLNMECGAVEFDRY